MMDGPAEPSSETWVVEVAPTLPTVVPGPFSTSVSSTVRLPPRVRIAQLFGPAAPSVNWMTSALAEEESPSTPAENNGTASASAERENTFLEFIASPLYRTPYLVPPQSYLAAVFCQTILSPPFNALQSR